MEVSLHGLFEFSMREEPNRDLVRQVIQQAKDPERRLDRCDAKGKFELLRKFNHHEPPVGHLLVPGAPC